MSFSKPVFSEEKHREKPLYHDLSGALCALETAFTTIYSQLPDIERAKDAFDGGLDLLRRIVEGLEMQPLSPNLAESHRQNVTTSGENLCTRETAKTWDLIFIDDEKALRDAWAIRAEKLGLNLLVIADPAEFLKYGIPREVPIFIDKNLAGNTCGIDTARSLFAAGYKKIVLCTGEAEVDASKYEFLAAVTHKKFPSADMVSALGSVGFTKESGI